MFDMKIVNGIILDGTGKHRFKADIAVNGDKIAAIGDLSKEEAKVVILSLIHICILILACNLLFAMEVSISLPSSK